MNNPPFIELRAACGEKAASGHISRCRTIMRALKEKGADVSLIPCLTPESLTLPSETAPDLILIDSYEAESALFPELKRACPGVKTAFIDDLNLLDLSGACAPDVVINYLPEPDASRYSAVPVQLLGPMYAPLRGEFTSGEAASHEIRENTEHIILTSGATDRYRWKEDLAKRIPEALPDLKKLTVIAGSYEDPSEYQVMAASTPCMEVAQNVRNMAELLGSADLVVSGGGTTLYELCALGIPAIIRPGSDWEERFTVRMSSASGMPLASDNDAALNLVTELASDPARREALSQGMHALTDGKGACRIADALLKTISFPAAL